MDLLNDSIKPVYFKYLCAAFGSAMITSVYSIVDMAIVGQYQGPDGTAALAVVAPVWNIIFSLGLLMGIGGSVIFSTIRGNKDKENANEYFSAALIGSVLLSVIAWIAILIFEKQILLFFGANEIGAGLSLVVMAAHFLSKKNTIVLQKPTRLLSKLNEIFVTGFPAFFIDVAMGILTILFNRQIMKYLGANALAIYGPIINVSTFVQCCAYSVGQASQPIISSNFGAKKWLRIKEVLHYALSTAAFFGIFWLMLSLIYPNLYIYVFMKPTEEILKMAPAIIRTYGLSFLLLPLNIFSTYYFQALMHAKTAFIISVARGCVISGMLILFLPYFAGGNSIWLAMPVTELLVAIYVWLKIKDSFCNLTYIAVCFLLN